MTAPAAVTVPAQAAAGPSRAMRAALNVAAAAMLAVVGVTALPAHRAAAAPAVVAAAQTGPADRVETVRALLGEAAARDAAAMVGLEQSLSARPSPEGAAPDGSDEARTSTAAPAPAAPGSAITLAQLQAQQALAAADARDGRRNVPIIPGQAIPQGHLPAPIGEEPAGEGTAPGPLSCPIAGPHQFIDTFGAYRGNGWYHQGTDMFAAEGTPVVAVAYATIVRINPSDSPNSLGGITVSYTTSNGDRWYNAHLSALAGGLTVGQVVPAGLVIGYVGRTGDARTTPPHLHIERHPGGAAQAVGAYSELKAACD